MCIVFFEWTEDRFVVCHNRDEFFSRPTTNIEWWAKQKSNNDNDNDKDEFEILAPRDTVSGGTWFGFEKTTGRCAFLTNIREKDSTKYASSRGEFVVNYLKSKHDHLDGSTSSSSSSSSALEYLQTEFGSSDDDDDDSTKSTKTKYAGFNLVVFSGHDLAYYSNRHPKGEQPGPIALSMGKSYGLSNSVLEQPYVKVTKGLEIFEQVCKQTTLTSTTTEEMMEELEKLMLMKQAYPGDPLPTTGELGFPEATVKHRSSICVPIVNDYGTRTMIRFILTRKTKTKTIRGEKGETVQQQRQQQLRCVETNLNPTTFEWDEHTNLNCTISS